MKEQFKKAGIAPAAETIAALADEAVKAFPKDRESARKQLESAIFADMRLLLEYIGWALPESARRVLVEAYKRMAEQAKQNRSGQTVGDNPNPPAAPGAGHSGSVFPETDARVTIPDAGAAMLRVPQGQQSRASPASGAKLDAAIRARSNVAALTVLDTFHITERNGQRTAIGDVHVSSYDRLAEQSGKRAWVGSRERELFLILSAKAKVVAAHRKADSRTRDIFSADEVADAIQRASIVSVSPDLRGFAETVAQ